MTDGEARTRWSSARMQARLRRRHAAERRFRRLGFAAILTAMASLAVLLASIAWNGVGAFRAAEIALDIHFDPQQFDVGGAPDAAALGAAVARADYAALVREALRARFPDARERREVRALQALVSTGAREALRDAVQGDPALIGHTRSFWLPADDEVDLYLRGGISGGVPESERRLSDNQIAWIEQLRAEGRVRQVFNTRFLTSGDSREPELAGVWGAVVGSLLTLAVTLLLVFPLGVSAAVYLEEFAPKGRWTGLIEVNINNLAAVPSIVFGLLGLAVFLNTFHLPRSAPLVGGLTLALMTLPTIIITGRVAIQAVPPSIREAARGIGASPLQVVAHHVLPLAMPGILTGTIIDMARALGETAPLLMIGMVAFIVDIPTGIRDAATVLPVQIFLWADSPERAFVEKTSGAILVLLCFLILMNATAIVLRKKFEKRW
ncbi:MAG TPA: phosphate ABC transporter permease PstA [Myxococcota bacterium]